MTQSSRKSAPHGIGFQNASAMTPNDWRSITENWTTNCGNRESSASSRNFIRPSRKWPQENNFDDEKGSARLRLQIRRPSENAPRMPGRPEEIQPPVRRSRGADRTRMRFQIQARRAVGLDAAENQMAQAGVNLQCERNFPAASADGS